MKLEVTSRWPAHPCLCGKKVYLRAKAPGISVFPVVLQILQVSQPFLLVFLLLQVTWGVYPKLRNASPMVEIVHVVFICAEP